MTFVKIQAVLESCGRSDCLAFFKDQEIGDEQLASLTLEDLKEIGVDKLGHRKAILSAIQVHLLTPSAPQKASLPQEVEPTGQETNVVPQGKPKIFLSYGRKDSLEVAERLERDLEAAGYEVWMDVKKIGSGSMWQQAIEDGLREAQVVVSLLSPHAVRRVGDSDAMDSVCLDELTFARTSSPPTPVVPAMVVPCEPPFIIYRLDYVHLTGWQQSEQSYQAGLTRLIEGIREALAGKVRYRVWEDRLRPLDFSDHMAQKRKGFVGREWLFEEIDLWRFESDERALLITGDPGAGKSSIVAQLVHANPDGQVIGYHCCQSNEIETLRPAKFVQSLAAMIASRIPAYAEQLEVPSVKEALEDKRCEADPGGAFLEGILHPLQKLAAPDEGVRYILVDALDEALGHSAATNIIDILASRLERLPAWLRIVATTRNEPGVIQRLSGLRAKSINASDPRNLEDLATYIRQRLKEPSLAERLVESRMGADGVVESLSRKSSGNFLYAVNALDGISRDFYSFANLDALPRGLDGLYLDFFRRIFGREGTDAGEVAYKKAKPLLQILCAAAEPLSRAELAAASNLDPDEDLPRLLRQLAQLLSKRVRSNGEETIALYHKSVADWLTTNLDFNAFAVSPSKGRKLLAEFCRGALVKGRSKPDWYVRRHAVEHFLETQDWDNATAALSDLEFIEARAIAQELPAMLKDYAEAVKLLPEGEKERQTEAARQAELDRYAREMYEFSATWTRIREGSGEGEPTLPRPVKSVRLWSEEEIAAERKRMTETPNRLDIVKAFRIFVATNSAPLQQYSTQEGFAANLARNDASAGPVHEEGKRRLEPLKRTKLIKQFAPEEVYNPLQACRAIFDGHTSRVFSVALSVDGRLAISGGLDQTLRVWNLETGECLNILKNNGDVIALALSADGRLAVSRSWDKTLRVWNLDSGECVNVLNDLSRITVNALSLSADGRLVVSGSDNNTLGVWNLETGECLKVLEGHKSNVACLALSADSRLAVSGSWDNTLRVWNLETGECLKVLEGHKDRVECLALSADGRFAVSGSNDKTLRVWNLETGECLKVLENTHGFTCLALSADGRLAVSGSGSRLRVWNLETGECLKVLSGHTDMLFSLALSADGRLAVSGSWDNTLRVWNLETGEYLNILDGRMNWVISLALSIGGRLAVSGSGDKTLCVWNLETGECLKVLEGHKDEITCLALSADGRLAVSGSEDNTLRVWNLETGECTKILEGLIEDAVYLGVTSVGLSADGRLALSGSRDETLRVWNLETGECLNILEGHKGWVTCLALSANGRLAISGSNDKTLRVWNLETGKCLKVFEGHEDAVACLALSADGQEALSGSDDKTLRVWNLETGECTNVFEGLRNTINFLLGSADNETAVAKFSDGSLFFITNETVGFFQRGLKGVAIHWGSKKVIMWFTNGKIEFYNLENLPLGPFITTAHREVISEDLPAGSVTARPPCCGQLISIPNTIAERIEHWTLEGGESGYSDPALLLDCPSCATPLRMNPFFVDVRPANT